MGLVLFIISECLRILVCGLKADEEKVDRPRCGRQCDRRYDLSYHKGFRSRTSGPGQIPQSKLN